MLVTLGRLPAAIALALGGSDQGGGVYSMSGAAGAIFRACGGAEVESGDNRELREDGGLELREDGSIELRE